MANKIRVGSHYDTANYRHYPVLASDDDVDGDNEDRIGTLVVSKGVAPGTVIDAIVEAFGTKSVSKLQNGYDYDKQAWVENGRYVKCNHPESMNCACYGKVHENEETEA